MNPDGRVPSARRPATPNSGGSAQVAPTQPEPDGVEADRRQDRTTAPKIVDIGVAKGAVNDDPGCPAKPCANFLAYPEWGEAYGIAGRAVSRFYFADVRYGGRQHLFVAVAEALGKAQLKAFLPEATKIFASVRVPATSA